MFAPAQSQPAQPHSAQPQQAPYQAARPEPLQPPEALSAQPRADTRPHRAANLSLADLDRVRQALQLLSDEPAAPSAPPAASDDTPSQRVALSTDGGDDADTTPLPVILPGAAAVPPADVLETPRGPFEPARTAQSASGVVQGLDRPTGSPAEDTAVAAEAEPAETGDALSPAAAEKLDQIKDLLITAEAIGEDNLDRHFERVSQRQRELIREFFEKAIPGRESES